MSDLSQLSDEELTKLYQQQSGHKTINQIESGGKPDTATGIVNPKSGARGNMQVKPKTADNPGYGIKPSNGTPEDDARLGREYYDKMLEVYKDPTRAAVAYNWGPGNADKWIAKGAKLSDLPDETLKYINTFSQKGPQPIQKKADIKPSEKPPEAKPTTTEPKDKDYAAGESSKATFGESLRDVGQAGLALGSSMVGGMAGLAAEAGAAGLKSMAPIVPKGQPESPLSKIDPYKVKEKVQNALSYEPKTTGAKAVADIASIPGRVVGYPLEKALEVTPEELKPAVDILGNALMAKAPQAAGAAVRRTMVGNEAARAKMRENTAAFKRAEIPQYTLGQVSEGGLTKGAGAPSKLIEQQKEQLAARAEKVADKMSQVKDPEQAGKIFREGIEGKPETTTLTTRKGANPVTLETGKKIGGYIDNARGMEDALYDKMYKVVGRDTTWSYPNLFKALDDMTQQNPNLASTSGGFLNRGILDLRERLIDDTTKAPKQLGYEDARWLRSKIGELTDPRQIVPGDTSKISITPAQASNLYAALSEDMMNGVRAKGPRAERATLEANNFSRKLHEEISNHLQPVMNQRLLKDTYDAAVAGTREGSERVATTMKTLDNTQKDAVRSVFFRELGREGENWNMKNFMNNYNKMHPTAKDEMFGGKGRAKFRNDLDTIAKVADKLTLDENTWHKVKNYLLQEGRTGTLAATAAVAGIVSHSVVGALLAGPAAGFVTGNLVRNPKFIDWFAKSSSKTKASSVPVLLSQLQSRTKDMSPEDKQEVDDYINKVNSEMAKP